MPFRYRLQKVLDFRIRKKEEQLLVVQRAQQDVFMAEEKIRENDAEIQQTITNKKSADFMMMEYYEQVPSPPLGQSRRLRAGKAEASGDSGRRKPETG